MQKYSKFIVKWKDWVMTATTTEKLGSLLIWLFYYIATLLLLPKFLHDLAALAK